MSVSISVCSLPSVGNMACGFFAVHESAECFHDGAYVVWFVKGCLAAVAFFPV